MHSYFILNNPPLSLGGWGALRLQVRLWARGSNLPGLPRQSATQPEGWVRALRQRGGHSASVAPGRGGALHPGTSPSKHGPSALLQRLHVLKPAPTRPPFYPTFRDVPIVPTHHHTCPTKPHAPLAHAHPILLYIRIWCFYFKLIALGIFFWFCFIFKSCIPLTFEAYSIHKPDCGWRDCLINTHNNIQTEVLRIL